MGAETFVAFGEGDTPAEAFNQAVDHAQWMYGHAGYTGTIAEKTGFKMVSPEEYTEIFPGGVEDLNMAQIEERLWDVTVNSQGKFWDDKWGDAAAIKVGEEAYYFFGWASS